MSIGRQDYTERKEARADRLEERAQKATQAASDAFQRSAAIVEGIPFGQPILVDHHSAKGHRRDLERSRKLMDKSVEASKKAARLQSRADAARENTAISGDDPEAVQKLRSKLENLQRAQEVMKAANAYYRKHKTLDGCPDLTSAQITDILQDWERGWYKGIPYPPYTLSNNNAEISRTKKRLAQLEAVDKMDHVEISFPGGVLLTNEDINRVQILFDDKPDEETRAKLKRYGFRWSPREGAWQTQRTPQALRRAKWLLNITEGQTKTDEPPRIPQPTFPDENEYTQATLA